MVAYGELRHGTHPDAFFARLPADETLIVRQLVAAVVVLYRQTEPIEPCSERQETRPPVLDYLLHVRVYRFLIEEYHNQTGERYAVLLHRLDNDVGHTDTVLAA